MENYLYLVLANLGMALLLCLYIATVLQKRINEYKDLDYRLSRTTDYLDDLIKRITTEQLDEIKADLESYAESIRPQIITKQQALMRDEINVDVPNRPNTPVSIIVVDNAVMPVIVSKIKMMELACHNTALSEAKRFETYMAYTKVMTAIVMTGFCPLRVRNKAWVPHSYRQDKNTYYATQFVYNKNSGTFDTYERRIKSTDNPDWEVVTKNSIIHDGHLCHNWEEVKAELGITDREEELLCNWQN